MHLAILYFDIDVLFPRRPVAWSTGAPPAHTWPQVLEQEPMERRYRETEDPIHKILFKGPNMEVLRVVEAHFSRRALSRTSYSPAKQKGFADG
jgi:hypothetical protein